MGGPGEREIWIDGRLRPWAEATVHVLSHSLQRGSLVFDYMSVHPVPQRPGAGGPHGDCIFRLDDHIDRFLTSCAMVGLELEAGLDASALRAATLETLRANPGSRAIKISGYLASIEIDVVPADPHVTVAIAAYDPQADIAKHKPARPPRAPTARIWIEKDLRNRRRDIVPPQAKVSANYVQSMTAKSDARRRGYDEILFIDELGNVAEGPTTNVFIVDCEGALRTPPIENVLLGVTRSSILEIAKHDGLHVIEAAVTPDALLEASEVSLTGTTAGVWPVASIDDQPVAEVVPGPVSRSLGERFRRIEAGDDPAFAHWLTPATASDSASGGSRG